MPDKPKIASSGLSALVSAIAHATQQKGPYVQPKWSRSGLGQLLQVAGKWFGDKHSGVVEDDVPYLDQYGGKGSLIPSSFPVPSGTRQVGAVYQPNVPDDGYFSPGDRMTVDTWPKTPTKLTGVLDPGYQRGSIKGLGNHSYYGSTDERGPYLSVYDIWDMDSARLPQPAGKLLDKTFGNPFTVYDQFDVSSGPDGSIVTKRRTPKR